LNEEEVKTVLGLNEIKTRHWGIIPCSAKTGDGLLDGIDWIVSDVAARIFMLE